MLTKYAMHEQKLFYSEFTYGYIMKTHWRQSNRLQLEGKTPRNSPQFMLGKVFLFTNIISFCKQAITKVGACLELRIQFYKPVQGPGFNPNPNSQNQQLKPSYSICAVLTKYHRLSDL